MILKWPVLTLLSLLLPLIAFCQPLYFINWDRFDTEIREKKDLEDNYKQLEEIKIRAAGFEDHVEYARARYYQLLITDARSEDSLYFRNASFVDSILAIPNVPVNLKLIMHMIQAKRLVQFTKKGWRAGGRYYAPSSKFNYAAFSKASLDSTIQFHYEAAKKLAPECKYDSPYSFTWLFSDPSILLFFSNLYDVITSEQIAYNTSYIQFNKTWKNRLTQWLSLSPADLIKTIDSSQDNTREGVIFSLYRNWLAEHKKEEAVYFYLETLVREYIFEKVKYEKRSAAIYEEYLKAGAESPFLPVRAYTAYQLCLFFYSRTQTNDLVAEKFPPSKYMELYDRYIGLFDNYPHFRNKLIILKAKLREVNIYLRVAGTVIPNEPILARVDYRNANALYYRIIKVDQHENVPRNKEEAIKYLLNKPPLRFGDESLPVLFDMLKHSTLLKIDPLPVGNYYILFSHHLLTGYDNTIAMVTMQATNIAIAATDNRAYVLDRKTGRPLTDAKVSITYDESDITTEHVLNRQGYLSLTKKGDHEIVVTRNGDTLSEDERSEEYGSYGEVYDETENEDLLEYYTDHARIHLLTDRSIYRPGQTVYYKGIIMTNDPNTGASIILNKKNLQHGLFRNYFKKWLYEEEPEMYIIDPFDRKVDTIRIKPDAYGAISGSYRIPASAATGEWEITGDIDELNWYSGEFRVEEYKRPTFELTAAPQTQIAEPGDSIVIKLKARSFAGGPMANTKVSYTISRGVPYNMPDNLIEDLEVEGIVQTKENGIAEIVFIDTALQKIQLPDSVKIDFHYSLKATSTDITGESHNVNRSLQASTQPVDIRLNLDQYYMINELKPIDVIAQNNKINLARTVKVKVFREKRSGGFMSREFTNYADQWIYPEKQLKAWFPNMIFTEDENQTQELVYETAINTGAGEKLTIPATVLKPGKYIVRAANYDDKMLRGELEREFTLYDTVSGLIPNANASFFHLPKNRMKPGSQFQLYTGSAFDSTYLLLQLKYYSLKNKKMVVAPVFREQLIKAGVHLFSFQLPADVKDHAVITSFFIRDNEVYRYNQEINIIDETVAPDIIIEQFRHKLTPGQQTTFSVSVKTKDDKVAAELISTMYDASLDKLNDHRWRLPELNRPDRLNNRWPTDIYGLETARLVYNTFPAPANDYNRVRIHNLNFELKEDDGPFDIDDMNPDGGPYYDFQSRVPGLEVSRKGAKYGETIVVGYGIPKAKAVYAWSQNLNATEQPQLTREPVVKVRSNFNELAFFYPAVHADRDGYYRFTFTVPESLTEWNWKLFAHTKNAQFAYAERKLTTQLPFMIQPNMPRHLYQGDRLVLKTRISNLDSIRRAGKMVCKVEDAVTGEDLTAVIMKNKETSFDVAAQSNTAVGFVLNIPASQLNPIKIIIKATAGEFSDGEEHIIPVMTDKILIKQAVPFTLLNQTDTLVSLPVIKEGYGLGLNIRPKPQSALINSLPFLANYSFDCAEQTFNKMLANIIALGIMRTDKTTQGVYASAKQRWERSNTPVLLPDQLGEQSMPWLHLNSRNTLQQKQLAELFDTTRTKAVIEKHLQKLISLQNDDGGLSWFKGGKTDAYITSYVLAGFGKLANTPGIYNLKEQKLQDLIAKLIQYTDGNLENDDIFNACARGYWKTVYPVTESQITRMQDVIKKQWERVEKISLHQQALLIIATMQWFEPKNAFHEKALQQLENIRQQAIEDPVNGIRWKGLADADDLTVAAEETLALLAEAFGKTPNATMINDGIVKWLLSAKTDHEWRSTKAAASAIDILRKTQNTVTGIPDKVNTVVDSKSMTVTDDVFNGEPFAFVKTGKIPEALTIKKTEGLAVQGNVITYHFSPASQLNQYNTDIQLTKQLFHYNNGTKSWEPAREGTVLKISEKVKVVLTIETARNLPYVYIDDKTSGAFEPGELQSGYQYESRINYYRSVRDAGMQFFAGLVPAGKTEISYILTVAQEGTFTNGPASLQCMYKPEKAAYSNSLFINTKE